MKIQNVKIKRVDKSPFKIYKLIKHDIIFLMIYFIRHAESQYNAAEKVIEHEIGEHYLDSQVYLDAKFDRKYMDVEITENGVQQTLQAKEEVKALDIDIVLVSPLRRALHTCSIIFEGHHSNPPIIVEPAFRQIMESSNDIGSEVTQSIQKYPFNFDQIKDHHAWFISTLHQEDRERIQKILQGLQGEARKEKAIEECLNIQKENWSERRSRPQDEERLKERIMPSYEQQKKVIQSYAKNYKNIAIVAHSECIKKYAGYKIANCQVYPFNIAKL